MAPLIPIPPSFDPDPLTSRDPPKAFNHASPKHRFDTTRHFAHRLRAPLGPVTSQSLIVTATSTFALLQPATDLTSGTSSQPGQSKARTTTKYLSRPTLIIYCFIMGIALRGWNTRHGLLKGPQAINLQRAEHPDISPSTRATSAPIPGDCGACNRALPPFPIGVASATSSVSVRRDRGTSRSFGGAP
ncbi:hypothetical protein FA13DRAFT_1750257 [Coprinellus micaceus]|uniref:Uncharacterized protein n=1 Tax=Coprinellus micaceus TaxID=71717 RepID=A0A4Y7R8Q9_COPMI|nr:hypothetical protein FA13DRAFT_1750257 [Coprinellus micaceus]